MSLGACLVVIGTLEIASYGFFLGVSIYFLLHLDAQIFVKTREISKQNFIVTAINEIDYFELLLMIRFVTLNVIRIFTALTLVIGVIKSSQCLMKTWMILKILVFTLDVLSVVLLIPFFYAEAPLVFAEIPVFALSLFTWAFVHTHCQDLNKRRRRLAANFHRISDNPHNDL